MRRLLENLRVERAEEERRERGEFEKRNKKLWDVRTGLSLSGCRPASPFGLTILLSLSFCRTSSRRFKPPSRSTYKQLDSSRPKRTKRPLLSANKKKPRRLHARRLRTRPRQRRNGRGRRQRRRSEQQRIKQPSRPQVQRLARRRMWRLRRRGMAAVDWRSRLPSLAVGSIA